MIRLAAFDLDGTVMGADRSIAPRVRAALAAAQARGVLVTLATGRMFPSVLPYALDLNLDAPLLACQGGWIQWTHALTPLLRIPLPVDIAREAIALAEQHDWHTVLYADGEIFLRELRELPSFYEALLGLEKALIPDWETVLTQHTPDKVLFVAQAEEIPAIGDSLRATFNGRAQVFRSHDRFIEVVPQGVDKGAGLAWLAAHLGIPREEVLAVGDHENDIPMVQWAGVGVAMGNATPALQAVADWIAPSVAEDGAAAALERFVLEMAA
ncbi:MAG: HAD family phosphatase [Anaerolineae bacterium]|nr:HAD family phosphatase [Anaerolineae bacterium]HOV49081.1 Cof-type HAD-IIB family hydrolase [Anaerolineae bacterium]